MSLPMKVVKSADGEWMFDTGPHLMAASCHHRKGGKRLGACGGCYARAVQQLEALAEAGIDRAQQFMAAVQAEGKER